MNPDATALSTTYIYAALVVLVIGIIIGKWIFWMKKTRQKQKEIVVFPQQQQDLKEKKNPKYFLLLDPFQRASSKHLLFSCENILEIPRKVSF